MVQVIPQCDTHRHGPAEKVIIALGILGTLVAWVFLSGCSRDTGSLDSVYGVSWPDARWETATPESQGIHSAALSAMMDDIDSSQLDIDAVVVVRNGRLVMEAYRQPYAPDSPHRIYSCTKSIVSTLVGRAIDDRYIRNTKEPVRNLFRYSVADASISIPRDLRLEHLLTMTAGLDARDSYLYGWAGLREIRNSPDPVAYALSRPIKHEPGSVFEYSNHSSFLLGAAVSEQTGTDLIDYADENLFRPLGIKDYRWDRLASGDANAWGGLWMEARDMARIGWMVARKGMWNGERIVSEEWLEKATSRRVAGVGQEPGYGYQWWIGDDGIPMALGYSGQCIIVVPWENLSVVFLSSLSGRDSYHPQRLFRTYIMNSVSSEPLVPDPDSHRELETKVAGWRARFGGNPGPPPEDLDAYWGVRYLLSENRWHLRSVVFDWDDNDGLSFTEEYDSGTVRYNVGTDGSFRTSRSDGKTFAMAAKWQGEGGFSLRELGLGQAFRNDYSIRFPEPGTVSIRVNTSSGETISVGGIAEEEGS